MAETKEKRITIIWSFSANIQSILCEALSILFSKISQQHTERRKGAVYSHCTVICSPLSFDRQSTQSTHKKEEQDDGISVFSVVLNRLSSSICLTSYMGVCVCRCIYSNFMCSFTRAINFILFNFGPWVLTVNCSLILSMSL